MSHQTYSTKASFDLTTFPSPEAFETVLDECGLEAELTPEHPFDDWDGWVWSNEDVAVHTYANPLTGERARLPDRPNEPGYASYIHVVGTEDAVEDVYETILRYASHTKEHRLGEWFV